MSIRLYRCIRSDHETLITFQGDAEDEAAINKILPFTVKQSKQPGLYEKGYYCYLRGEKRDQLEESVTAYLQNHYVAPEIRPFLFLGNSVLPAERPYEEWNRALEWEIRLFFKKKQYICEEGGLGQIIYRKNPKSLSNVITAYEGITYRISVGKNYVPMLQADIAYCYWANGKAITRQEALMQLQDEQSVALPLKSFETRDTEEILQVVRKFLQSLPTLVDGLTFRIDPVSAEELAWDTWFWEHDHPVQIEAGQSLRTDLAQNISRRQLGFYHLPDGIHVILVYPEENSLEGITENKFREVYQSVKEILGHMFGAHHPKISRIPYPIQGDWQPLLTALADHVQNHDVALPLYLLAVPPKAAQTAADDAVTRLNKQTFILSKELRKLQKNGYTVSLNWDNLVENYNRKYVIESALIKGLMVLGGIPWRVVDIACPPKTNQDAICFIGVDVNIKRKLPVVGGVVLDGYGVLTAYHVVRMNNPQGDYVDPGSWEALLRGLMKHYRDLVGRMPAAVVLHRDGLFHQDEVQTVSQFFNDEKIPFDLVEIRKSGGPKLWQPGNLFGTPSRDVAIGSETSGEAFLANTLVVQEDMRSGKVSFAAPESVRIVRALGNTPMKILANQVHALSRAYIGAYRRTERLPATTLYADAVANNVFFHESGKMDFGRALGPNAQPYWL